LKNNKTSQGVKEMLGGRGGGVGEGKGRVGGEKASFKPGE